MKYVAYYRSRPSEPDASAKAMLAQQKKVSEFLATQNVSLTDEFIEREGEVQGYPAYEAAIKAAVLLKDDPDLVDVTIIIATNNGIGNGEPFYEPWTEGQQGVLTMYSSAILDPDLVRIDMPAGAPQALFLYADFHPNQPDTLLYLCNGTSAAITSVEAEIDQEDMHALFSLPAAERWNNATFVAKKTWSTLSPRSCSLVAQRSHVVWDFVSRVSLTFIDSNGNPGRLEANDLNLDHVEGDLSRAWIEFYMKI